MHTASRLVKAAPSQTDSVLVLDFDARQKHRFVATLAGGDEIAVTLPRGSVLADGDVLETDAGARVVVRAAREELSVARTTEPLLFARVAYHLGNRHVALQVEPGCLKYRHDHVLDDMVRRLGAAVSSERAPFSPEGGAYGRGAHHEHRPAHGHSHADAHAHSHSHADAHAHSQADTPERPRSR